MEKKIENEIEIGIIYGIIGDYSLNSWYPPLAQGLQDETKGWEGFRGFWVF